MHKSVILLSTLFAAGAASAGTDLRIGARAFHPAQAGLEEAGCGTKTEAKGEKEGSCGAGSCGAKAKEGQAKPKQDGGKAAGKAKPTKGDKQASCGTGSCGASKPKEGKAKDAKDNKDGKGEQQASCGAKKDPKG